MEGEVTRAICVLENKDLKIRGVVQLEQPAGGKTKITVSFTGLAPGKHGFHIHQFGNLTNHCTTAGPHFNPFKKEHGGPNDENRHVGDLGNIEADAEGKGELSIEDSLIELTGENSVIGRSFVIHENEDDLGRGGHNDSKETGHAGGRLACGIIGRTEKF